LGARKASINIRVIKPRAPLELVDDVISRVDRVNPKINAVLVKLFDVEKARERAKQGIGDGPFAGVPVMLKNLTQYKDARIDFGSRLYARYIAQNGNSVRMNSPLIGAMERSGMIVAGVTNSPELGLIETTEPVLYGATRNPWNIDGKPLSLSARHSKIWIHKASAGSVPRAVASGVFANGHSLPLAVLTRRLDPDTVVPNM
jgi:Asp-tRNA(Asn)/Glu-tRNA(Gln) amidotransferase A subunit family amidase